MKIGVLSDSHGNIQRTAQAARLLAEERVEAVLHCGDMGAEAILIYLAGVFEPLGTPIHAVKGNVDLYDEAWDLFPANIGVKLHGREARLALGGKSIGIVHGDDARLLDEMIRSKAFDWIFTGHTHQAAEQKIGHTRIINPGALHRASTPSIAVVDLAADTVRWIEL
jgi:hypothetical protein